MRNRSKRFRLFHHAQPTNHYYIYYIYIYYNSTVRRVCPLLRNLGEQVVLIAGPVHF